jgi:hypothetical protein
MSLCGKRDSVFKSFPIIIYENPEYTKNTFTKSAVLKPTIFTAIVFRKG